MVPISGLCAQRCCELFEWHAAGFAIFSPWPAPQDCLVISGQYSFSFCIGAYGKNPAIFDALPLSVGPGAVAGWRRSQSQPRWRVPPVASAVERPSVALPRIRIADDSGHLGISHPQSSDEGRPLARPCIRNTPNKAPPRQFEPMSRKEARCWTGDDDHAPFVLPCNATINRSEIMMLGKNRGDRPAGSPGHFVSICGVKAPPVPAPSRWHRHKPHGLALPGGLAR